METGKSLGPTDEQLFPIFAKCGLTPDDVVLDMAERYRAYLASANDARARGNAGKEDGVGVPVAAETDGCTNPSEVILDVRAEGGSLTLYGARTPKGWCFSRRVIDQTMMLLDLDDGEVIDERSAVVNSWAAALELLDRYPWYRLHPIEVHADFRASVFEAVLARLEADNETDLERLSRWRQICENADA